MATAEIVGAVHTVEDTVISVAKDLEQTFQQVEKSYIEFIETSDKLNQVCKTINADYEDEMSQNDFFKLYCYNEYNKDVFRTNKTIHYQNILIFLLLEIFVWLQHPLIDSCYA